jgi:aminoglycoside 6'-N-acetyltransferase
LKTPDVTELHGERVVLRPLAAADREALRAIRLESEVAAWWGPLEDDFPEDDDPDVIRFTILRDGEVAGMIQFGEEADLDYRYAWVDIFVDPAHGRSGIGTDAIRALVRHLTADRGHHRITIDPALDNLPAIGCYEKAGFRRVGTLEAAARDVGTGHWRDVLLMELVVR